eukprot:s2928_g3.t2
MDGKITTTDLRKLFPKMTETEATRMIADIAASDLQGNGAIDLSQFRTMLQQYFTSESQIDWPKHPKPASKSDTSRKAKLQALEPHCFRTVDDDDDSHSSCAASSVSSISQTLSRFESASDPEDSEEEEEVQQAEKGGLQSGFSDRKLPGAPKVKLAKSGTLEEATVKGDVLRGRLAHIYLEKSDMSGEIGGRSFLDLAARACADAVAAAGKARMLRTWGQALLFRGRAMLRLGRRTEAWRSGVDSANRCQEAGDGPGLCRAYILCGEIRIENGDLSGAQEILEQAQDIAQRCNEDELGKQAEALLERTKIKAPVAVQQIEDEVAVVKEETVSQVAASSVAAAPAKKGLDPVVVRKTVMKLVQDAIADDGDLEVDSPFMEAGMDSLSSVSLTSMLAKEFGMAMSPSLVFDFPNVRALEEHLIQEYESQQKHGSKNKLSLRLNRTANHSNHATLATHSLLMAGDRGALQPEKGSQNAAAKLNREGVQAFAKGDFQQAITAFTEAFRMLEEAPVSAEDDVASRARARELAVSLVNRARAQIGAGDPVKAEQDALHASNLDPTYGRAKTVLAEAYQKQGRTKEAEALLAESPPSVLGTLPALGKILTSASWRALAAYALLAVLLFALLTLHRRLALDALYGRQPVLGDPELREVLRYSSGYGVGSFPARVRPEQVEDAARAMKIASTQEWLAFIKQAFGKQALSEDGKLLLFSWGNVPKQGKGGKDPSAWMGMLAFVPKNVNPAVLMQLLPERAAFGRLKRLGHSARSWLQKHFGLGSAAGGLLPLALYVQGTVADEQRLPQQLTFARLALLLVVAIATAIGYGIYVALISLHDFRRHPAMAELSDPSGRFIVALEKDLKEEMPGPRMAQMSCVQPLLVND